jgi:hypothetical protein
MMPTAGACPNHAGPILPPRVDRDKARWQHWKRIPRPHRDHTGTRFSDPDGNYARMVEPNSFAHAIRAFRCRKRPSFRGT